MSIRDTIPDAPFWSIDPTDWAMYHDRLIDNNDGSLDIVLKLSIADSIGESLQAGPWLWPCYAVRRKSQAIIILVDDEDWGSIALTEQGLIMPYWLRSDWLRTEQYGERWQPLLATPWGVAQPSEFAAYLLSIQAEPTVQKWWEDAYWHTHSIREAECRLIVSPGLNPWIEGTNPE